MALRNTFKTETRALRPGDGIGARVFSRVRQAFCGVQGHDTLRQFERGRMYLKCISCGYETPGWVLDGPPPRVTATGDSRRRQALPRSFANLRRIA